MSAPRVVLTRHMPPPAADLLTDQGYHVDELDHGSTPTRAEILTNVAGTSGIITMLSDRVDAEFLSSAGDKLRIVANYAVGFDNIDLEACRERGVRVSNTPGVLTNATADLAWSLILAVARHVSEGDRVMRRGNWPGWCPTELLGLELSGATLGIVGAGRIGAAVARRSAGFDMRVLYADQRENQDLEQQLGASRVSLDELMHAADVVSLHVPMSPENRHLINARRLRSMKPTAILINTARGPVVDEAALVQALREGRIAAAGLDVYEQEPKLTPGLAELPNVVLLPHLGSATHATRQKMSQMAAENVIAVLEGRDPPNAVA